MPDEQRFEPIQIADLLRRTQAMKADAYRLVQISATRLSEAFDLLYSFERGEALSNLRVTLAPDESVPSVCDLFPYAYLYENEMKDLFGISVTGLPLDFQGNLYRTAIPTPFGLTTGKDERHG